MQINIILLLVLLFSIYYNECNGKSCTCRVPTQAECESVGYLKYDADGNVERQCTWEPSHHTCRNTIWLECMRDENCIWINKVTNEEESKQPIDRIGNPCGYDQQDDEEYVDFIPNNFDEQTNQQSDVDIPNNDDAYHNEDDEADQTDQTGQNNVEYPGDQENVNYPGAQNNSDYPGDQNNVDPGDQNNVEYPAGDQNNGDYPGEYPGDQNNVGYPGDQDNVPGDEGDAEDGNTGDEYNTFWGDSTDNNNNGISSVYASDGSDGINREENADIIMSSIENRSSNIGIFALLIVIIGVISGGIYHFIGKTKNGEKIKLLKEYESGNDNNYEANQTIVAMDQHHSYSTF